MTPRILIVGSSNTDMVITVGHLPKPGETILGGSFFMNAGGKGANQAVAAARLGGHVILIAKTGDDVFGKQAVRLFEQEGIDTRYMVTDPTAPSGVALITVDTNGENCIAVASGANATLLPADLVPAEAAIQQADLILMQLEIPLETITRVAAMAASNNIKIMLNPAPACALPSALLKHISLLTPNETEAEILSGVHVNNTDTAKQAANMIRAQGVETVVMTMGKKGALIMADGLEALIPAPVVTAVDTTAAGDVFNGALAVALSEKMPIREAVDFACRAAALSVTRLGAQSSAPYRSEL